MQTNKEIALNFLGTLLAIVLLGAMFHWRATQNFNFKNQHPNDRRSIFFTFWFAGRMGLNGADPYAGGIALSLTMLKPPQSTRLQSYFYYGNNGK